jgi:leader peptidase (prepilin peptidase)/N-methyltransferase
MIDLKHQLLPDVFTLGLLWLGLLYHAAFPGMPLSQAVFGAVLGYGILWCVGTLFKLARNVEGMGYGDYKLLAVIGAWFGPLPVIFGMLLASVLSLIISLLLMAAGKADRQTPLPFGPYLALAALVILFMHPHTIIHWIYQL